MYNTIIIGSGISGLFVLKEMKDKNIDNVIVIDKNKYPFGVWNIKNHPSVLDNTYSVSSKLYMTISDFPMDKNFPEFPHHEQILSYYKKYAIHNKLLQHLRNNEEVLEISKMNKYWIIDTNRGQYKCFNLVIATGTVNNCINVPKDKIYEKFKGQLFHCDNFKHIKKIKNKKILIVGVSDTGADIAEYLKEKNKIYMSSRHGVWLQSRIFGGEEPADMFYSQYVDFLVKNVIGKKHINKNFYQEVMFWWGKGGSGIDKWHPKNPYLNSYFVKSRNIMDSISKGQIIAKNGIKNIEGYNVYFHDKTFEKIDIILFCTGYKPNDCLHFLDEKLRYDRYKHIFSPHDKSLYFCGFIRPYVTSIPMLSELQARWISQEIKTGNKTLPDKNTMIQIMKKDREKQLKEFPQSIRIKTLVDPFDYCNTIVANIKAKPNFINLLIKDPNLAYVSLFGTWNHHYFRLNDSNIEVRKNAKKNIIDTSKNGSSIKIRDRSLEYVYRLFFYFIFILILIVIFSKYLKISKR